MTGDTITRDTTFVTAVRSALAARILLLLDEAAAEAASGAGGGWADLEHRALARRVKTLVAAWSLGGGPPDGTAANGLLALAGRLAVQLRGRQGASGLFTGGDNVDSPPDTAFSVNDLADALLMLRPGLGLGPGGRPGGWAEGRPGGWAADGAVPDAGAAHLADLLGQVLAAASPALLTGGVHTPNHRWELSAALARLHRLSGEPALAARARDWVAEGIDVDDDGLYSERSAVYAACVSNPSLLVLADVLGRADLVAVVERNLDATLDLLLPDGSVETVLSRRQDQRQQVPLAGYLLPLRRLARLRQRGDLAWAAGVALAQGIEDPGDAAAELVLDPQAALALPAPVAPAVPRRRHFQSAGLLVDHRHDSTAVVFGGSDHPRHHRIRSGLANSPTFLRLFAGAAVLDSVRLTRNFFSHGPFRGSGLHVEETADGAAATLAETASAAYYQPLAPADRDPRGQYDLADDGRFSAAMDFGRRPRDEVTLTTSVRTELLPSGVELTVDVTGAAVDWALELAFRPGGTFTGARADGETSWQLGWPLDPASAGEPARYRVGGQGITVTVLDASDGDGGVLAPARRPVRYEPGEEYQFLGGTDAASGSLLYLSARVPAHVRIRLTADTDAAGLPLPPQRGPAPSPSP